jgi:hypothetical protein
MNMGESTGNRQVDLATSSDFDETFRVCRVFCADHFGSKWFGFSLALPQNISQILLKVFVIFCKKFRHFSPKT